MAARCLLSLTVSLLVWKHILVFEFDA
jgi:hypothetical protein